jgi:uncharacterized protein YkwD
MAGLAVSLGNDHIAPGGAGAMSFPRRSFLPLLAVAVVLAGSLSVASAAPARAATTADVEASILSLMNSDRMARGLRPLYRHTKLIDLARYRAGVLASKNVLSHSAAGSLSAQLQARGIQWYSYAENIAMTSWWSSSLGSSFYSMWKNSPGHWANMMSTKSNYVGIGVARSRTGATYAVMVFTESVDQTRPVAKMAGSSRSGTTVTWSWTGYDPRLQTHTAGLRDFDVQYRVGSGSWVLVRDNTTATSLSLANRPRGTTVSLRVRATDRRGLVGAWSAELRVSVP